VAGIRFFRFILLAVICGFVLLQSCDLTSPKYRLTRLHLVGYVLPGKTSSDDDVIVKFVWGGGGCIRSVDSVLVDTSDSYITVTPLSRRWIWGPCPADVFRAVSSVSLGRLEDGTYTIELVGADRSLVDSLAVPMEVEGGLFQFDVRMLDPLTYGSAGEGIEVWIGILDLELGIRDTTLSAVTDSRGTCSFEYTRAGGDTLMYMMGAGGIPRAAYLMLSAAVRGRPEQITFVAED
jgi:hypothetical protein